MPRLGFDEEDVALSAFHSLCEGITAGKFPQLNDRDDLWPLLVVIAARKAMTFMRSATTQKRGSGMVRGESVFLVRGDVADGPGIGNVIGREPTADFAAQVSEEADRLLETLPDRELRDVASLKMRGKTNGEISHKLDCGLRTVERRLCIIRKIWEGRLDRRFRAGKQKGD